MKAIYQKYLGWYDANPAHLDPLPPAVAVQGNLDPILLTTSPEIVRRETVRILEAMRGARGHVFNLGHGITPEASIECMETLVHTVTGWRN